MRFILLNTLFILLIIIPGAPVFAQNKGNLKGSIHSKSGEPLVGITVVVKGIMGGAVTDENGLFDIDVPAGEHQVTISGLGYQLQQKQISIKGGQKITLTITLEENTTELSELVVEGKSEAQAIRETGLSVNIIETKQIQSQSIDINKILDRTAGIRIRQSGGMGSDFNYSINGLSGKSIKFFVDGIPMDYFGRAYSINNFPVSLLERVEIYKGVVPVDLGSDALGGAINLITRRSNYNFLEASYSFGSFNTQQASIQGQWIQSKTNFTARVSAFLNKSDNNYKVWGEGVSYADASTGFKPIQFTKEKPATRFNDDFYALNTKVDIGFVNKKWADQLFAGVVLSDLEQGIQNGQTMGYVYGDVRYNENMVMPFLSFKKENLFTEGFGVNVFSSYVMKEATTVDTTSNVYDWRGKIINSGGAGGQINAGQGRSLFTLTEKALINRINLTYRISDKHKIGFNYLTNSVKRGGDDTFQAWYRTAYVEPQYLSTAFAGLSYESKLVDARLITNVFAKYYRYKATINEAVLTTTEEGEQQYISREIKNSQNNFGGGIATYFRLSDFIQPKISIEQTTRMPDATEALGNGVTVINNPDIQPEQSFNVNVGVNFGKFNFGPHQVNFNLTGFFRDTKDLLLQTVIRSDGRAQYQNIDKVRGKGVEFDFQYKFKSLLEFTANTTYLDLRNNQEFDPTYANQKNIVYQDRLRNTPYLMANAGVRLKLKNPLHKGAKIFVYTQLGYVYEYYLGWPSLGNQKDKNVIPSQLVSDFGVGYTFPKENLTLAFDASNLLNEQVFDNFLLQKPGRAFFLKATYRINSK